MEKGLTDAHVHENQKKYGENIIAAKLPFSTITIFLAQFPSVINGLLFVAALFSFFLGNSIDALFILAVLLVNGLFSFFQEYRAQKALEKLQAFSIPTAKVLRNEQVVEIPISQITVDDIVFLQSGDQIPADGVVTTGFHLEVDESLLTGESLPVIKHIAHEVFRGSFVAKGKAHMRVASIGMQTRLGTIAHTLAEITQPKTPLQIQITHLARLLSLVAVGLSLLLVPFGLLQNHQLFPLILLAVSIAVAAIPESLPGVITIALAVGASSLAKKNAIVRKMASIETLGATQIILTDKTGTLTQNSMTVKDAYIPDKKNVSHAIEACLRGNTAFLTQTGSVIGDKTDGALLLWATNLPEYDKTRVSQGQLLDEYAFDSKTKTITTIVMRNKKTYVYVRGAPEEILVRSTLSTIAQKKMQEEINAFAQKGLRVIGLGYKEEPHHHITREHAESHVHFLGLLALYDPPRTNSREAVMDAAKHGVRVIMVTGDNALTARSVAREVALADSNAPVLTGSELSKMSDAQLAESLPHVNIFARVSPEDKLRLVTLFQELGYVVGVTGDGINDALALEKADVGIAMGQKGSDVAKEAADIVLANDDIFTLISAIKEGRRIYANILKSITYLLAGNLSEILFVASATLVDHPLALFPTQVLWINLVTDAFPALALASSPQKNTQGAPRNPTAFLLPQKSILFIVIAAMLLGGINLLVFSFLLQTMHETAARTITFHVLIIFQLLLAFVVNKSLKDKLLFWSVALTIGAQILIATIPFFQHVFHLGLQ